jgi:hypothetical protein
LPHLGQGNLEPRPKSSQISSFSDIESNLTLVICQGSSTFKGISNVFSQMGHQTPAVIYDKYYDTYLY